MCGIVGLLTPGRVIDESVLIAGRDTLTHRGPDDSGLWLSRARDVGLAHRRLSVIDLSPTGHQPMSDDSASVHLILNGEIYNFRDLRAELEAQGYRFRGTSDTEVMLAAYRAWGDDFIERLNGMFAFALYDETRRRLLLARDRAGEKPLFYRLDETGLRFASELKAMLADPAVPRRIDVVALDLYLAFGYVPAPHCMLEGVQKLPAAHALSYDVDTGRCQVWRYWSLPEFVESSASLDELLVELETLLRDAVRRQLYADVPVGILLSGGVDSSLVTAFAAESAARVKTFTVAFPGHGRYDESRYARLVADHFGTDHTELAAATIDPGLLPTLARQYDEPIADSSMVPTYLVSALIAQHATVALGGDGGDELFGGYPHHSWAWHHEWIHRVIPARARRTLAAVGARLPVGSRGRNHLIGIAGDVANGVAHFNLYFDAQTRGRLLAHRAGTNGEHAPERFKATLGSIGVSASRFSTRVDFLTYLADDLLVKVDRASMLASLEVRAPFLDHRVIEFAFGRVPDHLRATTKERKILLRALAQRHLPPQLDLRRKQGFSLPLHEWFQGAWGNELIAILNDAPPTLFAPTEISALLRSQERGRPNTQRIFTLAMLELWRRTYDVRLPW